MANLKIFRLDDCSWYVAHDLMEFLNWYHKNINDIETADDLSELEIIEPEDGCMWCDTNITLKDIAELGDCEGRCKGGVGDLMRRGGEVYKMQTFADVLGEEDIKGKKVGMIGTTDTVDDSECRGLLFELEQDAGFMGWSIKRDDSGNSDPVIVYSAKESFEPIGIHVASELYMHDVIWINDYIKTMQLTNGNAGINIGEKAFLFGNGTVGYLKISSSGVQIPIAAGIFSTEVDVDMNGRNILNQSDARLKENIKESTVNALRLLKGIEIKEFDWIESGEHEKAGMIAQQVEEIEKDFVYIDENTGKYSIKTTKLIPYLIKAIQELKKQIDELQGKEDEDSQKWNDNLTKEEKKKFIKELKAEDTLEFKEQRKAMQIRGLKNAK